MEAIVMARPKKNRIRLSDQDIKKLKSIIKNKTTSQTIANRCRILLALDENHPPAQTYDQCMAFYCVSRATIAKVARTYAQDGLDKLLKCKRNVNSNNARRKVDGRMEARIIEIACGPAPEGHSRWTIRLLEDQAKIEFDEPVSRETIRRTLKKTTLDLTAANTGVSQIKRMRNL